MARGSSKDNETMQNLSAHEMSLLSLPLEIIFLITEHLCVCDALSLAATNHLFFDLINDRTYTLSIKTLPVEEQVLWRVAKQPSPNRHALSAAERALRLGAQPHAIAPRHALDPPFIDHDTPFLRAVYARNRPLIHLYLEHGVNPTTAGSYSNALTLAICQRDVETLSLLLDSAPDAATREKWASGPTSINGNLLQSAAAAGSAAMTSLLLSSGANPAGPDNSISQQPLELAIRGGFPDVVSLLLDAEVDMLDPRNQTSDVTGYWGLVVHFAAHASRAISEPKYKDNILRIAVLKVCLEKREVDAEIVFDLLSSSRYKTLFTMRMLLEAGLDVNVVSPHLGYSLLDDYATLDGGLFPPREETTREDWLSLLLEFGADVNFRDPQTGITPLIRGALGGKTEVVKLFLEKGADVSVRDSSGRSVLDHLALSQAPADKVAAVRTLLEDHEKALRDVD